MRKQPEPRGRAVGVPHHECILFRIETTGPGDLNRSLLRQRHHALHRDRKRDSEAINESPDGLRLGHHARHINDIGIGVKRSRHLIHGGREVAGRELVHSLCARGELKRHDHIGIRTAALDVFPETRDLILGLNSEGSAEILIEGFDHEPGPIGREGLGALDLHDDFRHLINIRFFILNIVSLFRTVFTEEILGVSYRLR